MNPYPQLKRGFTLIELLTVVAIIGILAALIFPAIKKSLQKAEITKAQTEVKGIETALKAYYNEYGKWPCDDNNCPAGGSQLALEGSSDGVEYKAEILALLQGNITATGAYNPDRDNPKHIHFLDVSPKSIKNGNYVDPWGNPYKMLFDINYDGWVGTKYPAPDNAIAGSVIVWSRGPDSRDVTPAETKDDVRSW